MVRGAGKQRAPRPTFQPNVGPRPQQQPPPQQQQQPQSQQPQQQQQYVQPIMIAHPQQQTQMQPTMMAQGQMQAQYQQVPGQPGMLARSPQQVMVNQVQMPIGIHSYQRPAVNQQQFFNMTTNHPGPMPMRAQQSVYYQPRQSHVRLQQEPPQPQQHVQQTQQHVQQTPQPQQHIQIQPQQVVHQQQSQQPQMVPMGVKRRAQETNTMILTEQSLSKPLISTIERNMNNQLFSHTLHRTFGPAVAQIFR